MNPHKQALKLLKKSLISRRKSLSFRKKLPNSIRGLYKRRTTCQIVASLSLDDRF